MVFSTILPDTYKIPAVGDIPSDFRVAFLSHATQANTIYGSKAVGEPPLMLAISVREAIRDADCKIADIPAVEFISERNWKPGDAIILVNRSYQLDRDALKATLTKLASVIWA